MDNYAVRKLCCLIDPEQGGIAFTRAVKVVGKFCMLLKILVKLGWVSWGRRGVS